MTCDFNEFDFKILEDPEFKEDSVREELIVPLIKALGYQVSGDSRVIRSKSLIHPFVMIGSQCRKISIIPDYLFLSKDEFFWILDAKSPTEKITKSKHVEQAYSYAIHPEIRADLYALCNGKQFVLYGIKQFDPILKFDLQEIQQYWSLLERILNPQIKADPRIVDFDPDYGLHLFRLGIKEGFILMLTEINTNFISKVEDEIYTTSTTVEENGLNYLMSLDFKEKNFQQLLKILPPDKARFLQQKLKRQPYYCHTNEEDDFCFGATIVLTKRILTSGSNGEQFVPFQVQQFFPFRG